MKKIFVFFVFLITFPLFSEKIHFRLANNQDKYEFIKNSEFYFDTQEDDISFYRDNYSFRETSLNTTINGNRKSILINVPTNIQRIPRKEEKAAPVFCT